MNVSTRFPAWLTAALLALLTVAVYWPAQKLGFVDYDDPIYVTANPHVQGGLTAGNVGWAFATGHAANWHPLTWLSLMLDVTWHGKGAAGMHFTNVILHVANVVLLFWLLRTLTGAQWRSAWVAAIFAVHPVHVESVAWVAERKDTLCAFFGFLTLIFYAHFAQEKLRSRVSGLGPGKQKRAGSEKPQGKSRISLTSWLAWFCFALGLMSKPMLVTWPFVMLLLDYWPLRRWQAGGTWRLVREKIPFIVLAVAASAVTFLVQKQGGAVEAVENLPWGMRGENAVVSCVRYLGMLFWPENLAVFYPRPGYWPVGTVCLAVLFLAAISALAWAGRGRQPFLSTGWLWFLGTLVPVIGLVQVGAQALADRYIYIPSVGVFVLVAWAAGELARRGRGPRLALGAAGGAAILACLPLTLQQLAYWQNSETLFRHTLAVTRNNSTAHNNLGTALDDEGRTAEAVSEFREALRIKPDNAAAHYNLGNVLAKQGQTTAAVSEFQEAARLNPDDADTHNNLGSLLAKEGQTAAAIVEFRAAIRLQPDDAGAHYNLGNALLKTGQMEEATGQFEATTQLTPDFAPGYYNLGVALEKAGKSTEALVQLQKAIQLKPDYAVAHNSLGIILMVQGRVDDAIEEFETAVRLKPDFASAQNNLTRALDLKNNPPVQSPVPVKP